MLNQSLTYLQALPDLSFFQFQTGYGDSLTIQLRFTQMRSGIYDLSIDQRQTYDISYRCMVTDREAAALIYTVVQVIELYTEKYPGRIIRLQTGPGVQSTRQSTSQSTLESTFQTTFQTTLFRVILRARHELLCPLFSIDKEGRNRFFPFRRSTGDSVFLLKRRADTELPPPPVWAYIRTRSRLFGNLVHVELHKEMNFGQLGCVN